MTLLGKGIRLQGITQKGKNRIREFGDRWTVLAETDKILFAPSSPGPWLFVTPGGARHGSHDSKASRWIRATGDPDFSISLLAD